MTFLQVIYSSEDIREVAPIDRGCYFQDEQDLEFYEKYSFINCQMECAISKVNKLLGCAPWYLPKVTNFNRSLANWNHPQANSTDTCDPWTAQEFEVEMENVEGNASLLCSHCLPDCNHVAYSAATSSVAFRSDCS